MPRHLFIILFIVSIIGAPFCNPGYTQESSFENLPARTIKKMAMKAEKEGDLYSSIDLYQSYLKKNEEYSIKMRLAELLKKVRNYKAAAEQYNSIFLADNTNLEALYNYALMLKSLERYDEAMNQFLAFKNALKNNASLKKKYKKQVEIEIEGCTLAAQLMSTPENIFIEALDTSINKSHTEFSPIPVDSNRMVYGSLDGNPILVKYNGMLSQERPHRKFFVASRADDKWTGRGSFLAIIEDGNYEIGSGNYSLDKQRFYFTRCKRDATPQDCKIYVTNKISGMWSPPVIVNNEINMAGSSNFQPCFGKDKKNNEVMYFVSDRPGGEGGLDIWVSEIDKDNINFKKAKNAGSKVNSNMDEITPFYDLKNRSLYFSSNGLINLGGFDIFKTQGEGRKWTVPHNLGLPMNSGADDLYYVQLTDKKEGFFTSNRPTGTAQENITCCNDIYTFRRLDMMDVIASGTIFEREDTNKLNFIINHSKYFVLDETRINYLQEGRSNYRLIENIQIQLFEKEENSNEEILVNMDTTDAYGKFNFELELNRNYSIKIKDFDKEIEYPISTKGITKSKNITIEPIGINPIAEKNLILKQIEYTSNSFELSPSSKQILDSSLILLLKNFPEIKVIIASHTDSIGSDEYNFTLSQKRAENVLNYLTSNGISKKRVLAKGFGETMPLISNATEEGRARNRRTEIRIVSSFILNDEDDN